MQRTASDLRTAVRQMTGTVNSQIVTDSEVDQRVIDAIAALYDEVIGIYEHYFVTAYPFTITSGSSTLALPPDFYKDNGVDFTMGQQAITVHKLGAFLDRNRRDRSGYGVVGQNLVIYPVNAAMGGNYTLYYTPQVHVFDPDFTVRLTTAAPLPSGTATGSGVGKSLTGSSFGALSVDGKAVIIGDRILVTQGENNLNRQSDNGIYSVLVAGDGAHAYVIQRTTDYDQASLTEVRTGAIIKATDGTANINVPYALGAFVGPVDNLGTGAQNYSVATLPPSLLPWYEYIQLRAALQVFAKRQMDPGDYMAQYARQEARVRKMAANRTEEPGQVPLTRGARTPFWDEDLPT